MSEPLKSNLRKKTYYLITHPEYPGVYLENFGDREFILRTNADRWYDGESFRVSLHGDPNWEVNDDNIHACADFLLERKQEKKKPTIEPTQGGKHPSYCCQKCGYQIGWIGRFLFGGLLHECKK